MTARGSLIRFCAVFAAVINLSFGFSSIALGAMSIPQLSQESFDGIERDFAANTTLHSVLPPSTRGSILGFEIGVVGGVAKSPNIDAEVQRNSTSGDKVPMIPHVGLVGAVSIPGALTFEGVFLPKRTVGDLSYQQFALALKWTMTDGSVLPVNIALRGFYAKSNLDFEQTLTHASVPGQQVPVTVSNESAVRGVQLLASPKLIPVLEPYVGVGLLSGTGSMTASSSAGIPTQSIFTFTSEKSATTNVSSSQLLAGLDIHLLIFGIGAEYSKAFSTDTYTFKLSAKF